jgi:uncharacterized protein (TIRG00374 family)
MDTDPVSSPPELVESPRRRRRWLLLGLRSAVAVLPLWWLWRTVDLRDTARQILAARPLLLAGAPLGLMLGLALSARRWSVLMRAFGVDHPSRWSVLFHHLLVSVFFNALPSGLAGDVVRGYRVRTECGGLASAYTVLFADRFCGLAGLLLVAALALLLGDPGGRAGLILPTLGVGALIAVGFVLAIFFGASSATRVLARLSRLALARRATQALGRVPRPRSPRGLAVGVLLSVLSQGLAVLSFSLCVLAVAPDADLRLVLRAIPAIMMLSFIQITPGAIGQRESLYVLFLGPAGLPAERALGAALLVLAVVVLIALVGGAVFLVERKQARSAPT